MGVQLYQYQLNYLDGMPYRHIMSADTGTGKTFMALEMHRRYWEQTGDSRLLIVAPAAKVRTGDWEREIDEYYGNYNKPNYEIYSYEKFSRNPSAREFLKGKRAVWQQFSPYHTQKPTVPIIADECHRMKNPQSGIGKAMYWATTQGNPFFIALSATPMPNGWIDFANYSKIFGFTKGITAFKNKYCRIETFKGFPEIVGYNYEKQLSEQWTKIASPLSKSEALDLPSKTFIGVDFKRPSKYVKYILDRVDDEGNELDSAPKLAHSIRQTLTAPKLDYLSEILEGTTENVVIFYNYISERDAILELLATKHKAKKVFRQDGDKHELPPKHTWANISNSVTLGQYKSSSTGVEMTYATQVVYFSPTYSYADYEQSIGRVYRNGQSNKTTFYNFRVRPSIEVDIYTAIANKKDFQTKQWAESLGEDRV